MKTAIYCKQGLSFSDWEISSELDKFLKSDEPILLFSNVLFLHEIRARFKERTLSHQEIDIYLTSKEDNRMFKFLIDSDGRSDCWNDIPEFYEDTFMRLI